MADGVDIDLYADDLEQDFAQVSLVIYTYQCNYRKQLNMYKVKNC